jgi:hypothetical protein
MKHHAARLLLAAGAVLVSGCADIPQATVLNTVGPTPASPRSRAHGYLVAYTPVKLPPLSSDTLFYPHTSYAVYDSRDRFLFRVRNHLGAWDESPELVTLRPGRYTIHAQSDFAGDLIVPILIRGDRTTVVDLARNNHYSVTALNPG